MLESEDVEGSNDSSDICIRRSPQDMANFAAVLGVRGGLQCVSEVWPHVLREQWSRPLKLLKVPA